MCQTENETQPEFYKDDIVSFVREMAQLNNDEYLAQAEG